MKKLILLLAAVLLFTVFTGCGPQAQSAGPATAADKQEAEAQAVADEMQNKNFEAVTGRFDSVMASSLSTQDLAAAWKQTTNGLGRYMERGALQSAAAGDGLTVTVPEIYEQKIVDIQISFNSEGQIQGLFFTYRDKESAGPQSSALPPQGITEEFVTVAGDASLPLQGTLTLPENVDKPPVVVLIQGSGQSDKDETVGENKPFRDLAWGLAQKGIATLRYDKRYYTYPAQAAALGAEITVYDEILDDAQAAINLLQNDSRVDTAHIFLLGHSQGGMLTPYLAAKNPQLAGCISMAGSLRPLWEIIYDQNVEAADRLRPTLNEAEQLLLNAQLQQLEKEKAQLAAIKKTPLPENGVFMGLPARYWQSLSQTAGTDFLQDAPQPFLILQGSEDFQVYPDKDYTLWQSALSARDNATFRLYEGLNHLLMPASGKRDISEYDAPKSVAQQVIEDIAAFITAQ